jgi:hypothetical protein
MNQYRLAMTAALPALLLLGCSADKGGGDGSGEERDGRLISDVYSWLCDDGSEYQGVFKQEITLEYAPDGLGSLEPPSAGGCQIDKDMFPTGAGSLGTDLPDLSGEPTWSSAVDSGELQEVGAGFWRDNVTDNVHSCQDITDLMESGIELTDAGVLTGTATPAPPEIPVVDFDGLTYHPETGAETIEWGDEIVVSWDDHGWEEVWVQVRREREGEAWESVTCNATGDSSFTMESDVWDLMNEDLEVEHNNIYVAFTMSKEETSEDGLRVEAVTRAMAVAVVQD